MTEGPFGRKTRDGKLPRCAGCGSLERHRVVRSMWNRIVEVEFRDMKALQFSRDPAADAGWFDTLEVSVFGRRNSLDLQSIDRPNGTYDIVICNHVLEHVQDDAQAFRELMRILKPGGFLQFSVPSPHARAETEDWGYPKAELHGHFRTYGRDLVQRFADAQPGVGILVVPGVDEVTGSPQYVYFASFDRHRLDAIHSRLAPDRRASG